MVSVAVFKVYAYDYRLENSANAKRGPWLRFSGDGSLSGSQEESSHKRPPVDASLFFNTRRLLFQD